MGNIFIWSGIILVCLGIIVNMLPKGTIPLLPGDILIQRENFTFYFPVVTSIIVSVLLTLLIRFFK